jgi:hypothetical protein
VKLITKVLPSNHNLFLFGDVHDGSVLSSKHGWQTLVNLLGTEYDGCKNNYCAEGGDMVEAIMVDDRRYSPEKLSEPLPLTQVNSVVEKREAIKDKMLYLLEGNHERTLWRFGNLTAEIAGRLGVEYGTYSAKLTVNDKNGNLMYKLFDTHGIKGISSTADDPIRRRTNMELILKRHLKHKAGDCAVMIKHHVHKLLVCKPEPDLYLIDDGKRIKQQYTHWGQTEPYIHPDARWYGCAGSFLRLYGDGISGYAEIAEYDPVELGFLCLVVRNKKIVDLRPIYLNT